MKRESDVLMWVPRLCEVCVHASPNVYTLRAAVCLKGRHLSLHDPSSNWIFIYICVCERETLTLLRTGPVCDRGSAICMWYT